ncbi:MAG: transcriptional regulator [Treponema sp.]|jgi:DNA-binding MarR family transcriptional regulator|nr:transcriptional regulator [Treponema sp.]
MKDELKHDLIHALFRFKKVSAAISRTLLDAEGDGLSITELSALGCISTYSEKNCSATEHTTHHAMHKTVAVSKAAVSHMLGSLEKRGYIQREIDKENRRKIIITLTNKGKVAVDKAGKDLDEFMSLIIARFGEKDTETFVGLLNQFEEVVDEVVSLI